MYVYGCDVLALHVIFYWFAACRMGCCRHYVFDLSISLCVCACVRLYIHGCVEAFSNWLAFTSSFICVRQVTFCSWS